MNLEGVRPKESIHLDHLDLNFIYQKLQHIFMKYRRRKTSRQFWELRPNVKKPGFKKGDGQKGFWWFKKDNDPSFFTLLLGGVGDYDDYEVFKGGHCSPRHVCIALPIPVPYRPPSESLPSLGMRPKLGAPNCVGFWFPTKLIQNDSFSVF